MALKRVFYTPQILYFQIKTAWRVDNVSTKSVMIGTFDICAFFSACQTKVWTPAKAEALDSSQTLLIKPLLDQSQILQRC